MREIFARQGELDIKPDRLLDDLGREAVAAIADLGHHRWLRPKVSFRDVEDLLAERGTLVSYETVRRWVNHFGPMIAADLRRRRSKPHTTWHLDEVYLKIDGRLVYLRRAVDAEGEVLCLGADSFVRRSIYVY